MFGLLKRHLTAMLAAIIASRSRPSESASPPDPPWLITARQEIGFRERPGNCGIERYVRLAHAGCPGDPWCAIFVNAMLESAGYPGTRSAAARSFEHSQHFVRLEGPALGCIATMWRQSKASGLGHVFLYLGENDKGRGRIVFTQRTQQMIEYAELKSEYAQLWTSMEIRPDKRELVMRIARKLMRHRAQYLAVESRTGVPWFVVAALHNRESDANFATYLGNGESLDRKTVLVPKGRGPFDSWEAGAVDALALDGLDQVKTWSPERACFEIEKFNGFGYRKRGVRSPYLWSFSNHYVHGKYVADGRFSSTHVDEQCGAIPILKAIMELDSSARFKATTSPATKPITITTILGGILGILAHVFGISSDAIGIILIGTLILAAIIYAVVRIRR